MVDVRRTLGRVFATGVCWVLIESSQAQSLSLSSPDLKQGEILLIRVDVTGEVVGEVAKRPVNFFPGAEGRKQWALWGADMDETPGVKRVEVRVKATEAKLTGRFRIVSRAFPFEELTVASKFIDPPADVLQRMELERRKLESILSESSPIPLWIGKFGVPRVSETTSPFGMRRVFNGRLVSRHIGVDFRAEEGAEVYAPNSGRVVLAAEHFLTGKTMVLDHGLGLHSIFIHLSRFEATEGAMVVKGDLIGRAGSTGRVTAPHLHWSVRLAGARIDPLALTGLDTSP